MTKKEKWRGGGVVEALSETIIILSLYHALKRSPLTFHRLSAIKTLKKKKIGKPYKETEFTLKQTFWTRNRAEYRAFQEFNQVF